MPSLVCILRRPRLPVHRPASDSRPPGHSHITKSRRSAASSARSPASSPLSAPGK
ncbi:MAG: hypothetical protein ACK559_24730 [bacterium]